MRRIEIIAMIEERLSLLATGLRRDGLIDAETGELTVPPGHSQHRGACQVVGACLILDELLDALRGTARPAGAALH